MTHRVRRLAIVCAIGLGVAVVIAMVASREFSRPLPSRVFRAAGAMSRPYLVARNIPYRRVGDWTGHADIYRPAGTGTFPVVLFLHGGGWVSGRKSEVEAWTVPFMVSGYAVVAVSYRLADDALAPAAVEDARCALGWVAAHAAEYQFDQARIVTAGTSAGGHLALMAGLLDGHGDFDTQCAYPPARVRAIVNFWGITDVADLLRRQLKTAPEGWPFAVDWLGHGSDRFALAERVSPLTWIDSGDPPVLSVHGTADSVVPYDQAVVLHRALQQAGVANDFVTLQGREHGDFSLADLADVARRMQVFVDPKLRSALVPVTYGAEPIGATPALPYNAERNGA